MLLFILLCAFALNGAWAQSTPPPKNSTLPPTFPHCVDDGCAKYFNGYGGCFNISSMPWSEVEENYEFQGSRANNYCKSSDPNSTNCCVCWKKKPCFDLGCEKLGGVCVDLRGDIGNPAWGSSPNYIRNQVDLNHKLGDGLCGNTCTKSTCPLDKNSAESCCECYKKLEPTKPCPCEKNKLIVEESFFVSSAEKCQDKCQQSTFCKFFTYNSDAKACGLRNYTPGGRAFSFGNLSGLKNESPTIWKQITDSVYVGMMMETGSCESCQAFCQQDGDCKALIFNKLWGQCSLIYGDGPFRELHLPPKFDCFGIESAYKCHGNSTYQNSAKRWAK